MPMDLKGASEALNQRAQQNSFSDDRFAMDSFAAPVDPSDPSGACAVSKSMDMASPKLAIGSTTNGNGDTFDFQPQLTSEPAAAEARHVGDCESKVFLTEHILGDGDGGSSDGLAVDPTNPNTEWPIGPIPETETLAIAHEGFWLI